jgi:Uma2 family endonuclease
MVTAIKNFPSTVKLREVKISQKKNLVRRLTLAEFQKVAESLPDDRIELINGEIVMTPPPDNFHIERTLRIENLLIPYYREIMALGCQISGSSTWYAVPAELTEVWVEKGVKGPNHVCPDASVCFADYLRSDRRPPALLIVEIISISSQREIDRDLIRKPDIYATLEVPTYWVIDRRDKSVWVHTAPKDEKYTKRIQYQGRKKLPAPGLDFLTITPAQIFAN